MEFNSNYGLTVSMEAFVCKAMNITLAPVNLLKCLIKFGLMECLGVIALCFFLFSKVCCMLLYASVLNLLSSTSIRWPLVG